MNEFVLLLKGRTVWTKIIRNQTAVDYLFNADAFDFNYQFENRFAQPIQLYPVRFFRFSVIVISNCRVMNWLLAVFIVQQIKI